MKKELIRAVASEGEMEEAFSRIGVSKWDMKEAFKDMNL